MIDRNNYLIIGISPFQQSWQVIRCVNGTTSFLGEGWDPFPVDQPLQFVYSEANGRAAASVAGRQLWSGSVGPFTSPTPMGVALYGVGQAPPALYDDFRVTIP